MISFTISLLFVVATIQSATCIPLEYQKVGNYLEANVKSTDMSKNWNKLVELSQSSAPSDLSLQAIKTLVTNLSPVINDPGCSPKKFSSFETALTNTIGLNDER